jgi:hypothetical protein
MSWASEQSWGRIGVSATSEPADRCYVPQAKRERSVVRSEMEQVDYALVSRYIFEEIISIQNRENPIPNL